MSIYRKSERSARRSRHRRDKTDPTPARLRDDSHAQAFWGLARRNLEKAGVGDSELAADIALEVSKIVQNRRKVGWQHDRDIENLIRNDIDDFLFVELRGKRELALDPSVVDGVVDDVLSSARVRDAQ